MPWQRHNDGPDIRVATPGPEETCLSSSLLIQPWPATLTVKRTIIYTYSLRVPIKCWADFERKKNNPCLSHYAYGRKYSYDRNAGLCHSSGGGRRSGHFVAT